MKASELIKLLKNNISHVDENDDILLKTKVTDYNPYSSGSKYRYIDNIDYFDVNGYQLDNIDNIVINASMEISCYDYYEHND